MKRMDQEIRQQVFERDNYTCRYCGNKDGPYHADHVYPYVKGGETSINNLVTACEKCNMKKGSKVGKWPLPIGHFDKGKKSGIYPTRPVALYVTLIMLVLSPILLAAIMGLDYHPFLPPVVELLLMGVMMIVAIAVYETSFIDKGR